MKKYMDLLNENNTKLNKVDYIILGIMVLIYGIISFYKLGDLKGINTFYTFNNDEIVINLKNENYISKMRYYTGINTGDISIYYLNSNGEYIYLKDFTSNSVLCFEDTDINTSTTSLKFIGKDYKVTLGDIGLYDNFNNRLNIINDGSPITDEMNLIPNNINYMNSIYFDEVYFARSAYEYANGLNAFEWSHPPIGKIIMSIPVWIFGYSPFNVRLMGNIAGILIIPAMYILCMKIFKKRRYALLGALIMMFDNFHFAHTRIALVDSFEILFMLLSTIFMKNYLDLDKDDSFKKKVINLSLSGLFMGLSIGVKWNACYFALALAIVFFYHLSLQYNFNIIKYCKKNINLYKIFMIIYYGFLIPVFVYHISFMIFNKSTSKILLIIYLSLLFIYLLTKFFKFLYQDKYLFKLFITCIISFIIIPVFIYFLSYLLFPNLSYYDGTFKGIFDINKMMYEYHANLDATHPFTSKWFSWPIMYKPVWFYSNSASYGFRETITDIGNPMIWWFSVISFIYLIFSVFKKNKNSIFILILILGTFIPYIFIGRIMFMYHYFITLPFMMLTIVSFIKWLDEKYHNNKIYFIYVYSIIIMFFIFYPVVSGMSVSSDYIESLKWLSSWYF